MVRQDLLAVHKPDKVGNGIADGDSAAANRCPPGRTSPIRRGGAERVPPEADRGWCESLPPAGPTGVGAELRVYAPPDALLAV